MAGPTIQRRLKKILVLKGSENASQKKGGLYLFGNTSSHSCILDVFNPFLQFLSKFDCFLCLPPGEKRFSRSYFVYRHGDWQWVFKQITASKEFMKVLLADAEPFGLYIKIKMSHRKWSLITRANEPWHFFDFTEENSERSSFTSIESLSS